MHGNDIFWVQAVTMHPDQQAPARMQTNQQHINSPSPNPMTHPFLVGLRYCSTIVRSLRVATAWLLEVSEREAAPVVV